MTVRLPDRSLRIALATVLTLAEIKLLELPGSDALVIAVLFGGLVLMRPARSGA